MTIVRDKFDFEIGTLVKSPCRTCEQREQFPKCSDNCQLLDQIRTAVARGISCSNSSYNP